MRQPRYLGARYLCASFVLLTVVSLSGLAMEAAASGEPPAATDQTQTKFPKTLLGPTTYDFGTVPQGTAVQHSFLIENHGEAALKIDHIHSACGCTAAVLDSDTILPGQKTELRVTFDTTGFQGPKVKTVRIYTNDPKLGSALFTIQGTVRPDIDLSTPKLQFGEIRKGDTPSLDVRISSAGDAGIQIGEVSARSENITVDVAGGDEKAAEKRVTVTLKDSLPIGIFRDRIVVKTTSKNNPVLNIPIFAKIVGDVKVEPSVVSFGLMDGPLEAPVSQLIKLQSRKGRLVHVKSVSSDLSGLVADVVGTTDDGETTIKVVVREEVVGVFRANLTINTDSEQVGESELSVPVYGIVSKKAE